MELGDGSPSFLEPAGVLAAAGARIAYGSDWPVDSLDEWFALKVGVTRTNSPKAGKQYAGRLSEDSGLTRKQALRAMTINASYELHQDANVGSLETGKLADFIVLDRNFFDVPAEQIANIKVLETVVGGRVVMKPVKPPTAIDDGAHESQAWSSREYHRMLTYRIRENVFIGAEIQEHRGVRHPVMSTLSFSMFRAR